MNQYTVVNLNDLLKDLGETIKSSFIIFEFYRSDLLVKAKDNASLNDLKIYVSKITDFLLSCNEVLGELQNCETEDEMNKILESYLMGNSDEH